MKFGLLSVSYAGMFYSGEALTLEQQITKVKSLGFDGLSIEAKRPIASPLDLTKKDRARIKAVAADQGVELCAIESLSNFASDIMEERENNLAMMRLMLELAADLGVNLVKVFAAWPGIIDDAHDFAIYGPYEKGNHYKRLFPEGLRKWNHVVEGLREVADQASDMGINLALQNHAPVITPGYEDLLSMKNEIDRQNVKLCLDVPLFYERQEDRYVRQAVQMCRKDLVMTHFGAWNFKMDDNGKIIQEPAPSFGGLINYKSFIDELNNIDYDGYLISEYCVPLLKNHQMAGIDEIDKANAMALNFIKELVNKTTSVLP